MTTALLSLLMSAPPVEIIGHRGASYDAPENTVAAMRLAWEQKSDAAELDVYLSKDGRIVLLHDATLKRTAGVDRKVTDMTADELTRLDVGSWKDKKYAGEKLPLLADVLPTVPVGKRLFIEVKCGPEIVPELDRVLRAGRLKPEQTAVISFSADVIAAVKRARPDLQAYWIVSLSNRNGRVPPTVADMIAKAKEIRADGLDLSATPEVLTADASRAIKAAGLKLYVWTVNDAELARTMIANGVDGITTDRPGWLREQLHGNANAGRIRVMTYNIHHGRGGDNRIDLQRIADVIRKANVDIVALQEVDDKTRRSGGTDQTAELARLTALHGRFGKAIDYDGGSYGQAILSRYPIGDVTVHKLPGEPEREQRIAVEATLNINGRSVSFVTTHLHHQDGGTRERQAAKLNELFAKADRPIILAGDFNALEDSPPMRMMFQHWQSLTTGPTYPASEPRKRIDYILVRSEQELRVASVEVVSESVASDHRPVVAVVEWTNRLQ